MINLAGGSLNLLKLVKLLYFADRKMLVTCGRPITFDAFVSMPHGPVVSNVYRLINEEPAPGDPRYWHCYISERGADYELKTLQDPGHGALSRAEVATLDAIFEAYGGMDKWALRDLSHELPEWEDPCGSSFPIDPREVLVHEGYDPKEAEQVLRDLEHESSLGEQLST